MKLIKNKQVFGWVMYDWANSAFATTVMAGFFPVFFKNYWSATADVNQSTAFLGLANSIAALIVALLAPILGAIADQTSSKKRFLIFFAYLSVLMTACLFLIGYGQWLIAAIFYVIGTIGFSGANIFYDSLLPTVANKDNIDFISSKGYAMGYLGGGLLFLINVLWYLMPATFGFQVEQEAKIDQLLQQNMTIIQLADDKNFQIPENKIGKAKVTSHIFSPIQVLEYKRGKNYNFAKIKVTLPENINTDLIGSTLSFGNYKFGKIVNYYDNSIIELVNITRKIENSDTADFVIKNDIIYEHYNNGVISGVKGLENHFNNITIKTDFLPPSKEFLSIRLSFISVALWWGIFTIPIIIFVKEKKHVGKSLSIVFYVKNGFGKLAGTFKKVKHLKVVFTFLIAYWLYIDGVNTIIRMAVDYGMSIGFPSSSLIVALLITQFVGFPSALFFGKLGEMWDVKKAIFVGIFVYLAVTIWGVMMDEIHEFYVLAIVIGIVQGGIQALSRSYYSRLIPPNQTAEFYGFFNMVGKFAAIFGPAMIGLVNVGMKYFGYSSNTASRMGLASISILFITGAIFLYFVDAKKGAEEIKYLS